MDSKEIAQDFTPREYQTELFEEALKQNVIVFLPTGCGKTFIATMLIKHMSKSIEKKYSEGGKRTFFLVCTVTLAQQQADAIKKMVPFQVGTYTGDMGVDYWKEEKWNQELEKNEILVMTAQIFLDLLNHSYISFSKVNLLVLDECHHAVNKHAMRQIMARFEVVPLSERPRILGLTATLLNSNAKAEQISSEIHSLEVSLHSKICRAKNEDMLKIFSTSPEEEVIYYEQVQEDKCYEYIETVITDLVSIVKDIQPEESGDIFISLGNETGVKIEGKSECTKVVNMLNEVKNITKDLGTLAGSYAILVRLFNFERLKINTTDKALRLMYCMIITTLHKVRKVLRLHMEEHKPADVPHIFSTPKLKALFEKMKNFPEDSSAIVFVTWRASAQVLYYIFKNLAAHDKKFEVIKPDFIVGCNSNPFNNTREPELERKKNKETMKRFNSRESNVLFASNVVEEGIDIKHCNYVIKFDHPTTLCSYIQSKGRARHEKSKYLIFAPNNIGQGKKSFSVVHNQYKAAENKLKSEFTNGRDKMRVGGTEEEARRLLYSNLVEPFYVNGPKSAVVTLTSAIALLNRYCTMLPADSFTKLTPTFWKSTTDHGKVVVCLQLPMNCPLRGVIESIPCSRIDEAKACAALEACKKLYYLGELNDKLLPVGPEVTLDEKYHFPLWIEDDRCTRNSSRPGSKKRIRAYDRKVPDCMHACTPKPELKTYIHVIKIKPEYVCSDTNRHKTFYNLLSSSNTFAILTSKPWPKVCKFPMFMNVGEVSIHIKENYSSKKFNANELARIFDFHCLIVTQALPMKREFLVKDLDDGDYSYYIAPVVEKKDGLFDIDWPTILQHKSIPEAKPIPTEKRGKVSVTKDKYLHKIVIPWYRPHTMMLRYIVTEVCENLCPLSPFPSECFTSYEQYFSLRYSQQIVNKNQPLLEVRAISQKNNCLLPRGKLRLGKRNRDKEDLEEILVPELCFLLDFPSVYLLKVTLIPSVMHRLALLFLAEELRVKIASEVGLGKVILDNDHEWEPLKADETAVSAIEEPSNQNKSTIEVSNMLASEMESLNPSDCPWDKADEPCDIERNLETIDLLSILHYDKFVNVKLKGEQHENPVVCGRDNSKRPIDYQSLMKKYPVPPIPYLKHKTNSTTPELSELAQVFISLGANDIINYERLETLGDSFLKYLSCLVLFTEFPNKDEGKLTNLKGRIVGNRNLFYCGRQINLGNMLKVNAFIPEDWDIPHYKLLDVIKSMLREANISPDFLNTIHLSKEERHTGLLNQQSLDLLYKLACSAAANDDSCTPCGLHILQQEAVNDKSVADAVEALIGVYLKTFGIEGAFRVCKWLQLIPQDWIDLDKVLYQPAPTAQLNKLLSIEEFLIKPYELERNLGYTFKDRSYLLQALSHSSFCQFATDCYQRLEFLGDAILDFLITCHIYDKSQGLSPGELTDLRSALVNNTTFACLTVRYGFHKYMLSKALALSNAINKFAEQQEKRNHKVGAEVFLMVNEKDVMVGEVMDVPKVLGDVFESLAGAVYLDSGKSLQTVWNVFYRLMHNEITEFSKKVPKNNLRLLYEKFPNPLPVFEKTANWNPAEQPGHLISLIVTHYGERKVFYGFGDSKANAKLAAAKVALRHYHGTEANST